MAQKLLITGTSGFLGNVIAAYYEAAGTYQILKPSHRELDIEEKESVQHYFAQKRPDIVVHCAAVSDIRSCEENPEHARWVNVEGSINIAEAGKKYQAKCVLCSSDQVYVGSDCTVPHKEEESLWPLCEYGRQKLQMEQSCLQINSDCVILRLSWMYDPNHPNWNGDFIRILAAGIQEKEELRFSEYDQRGITNATLAAANLEKVFRLPGGVYNYASPNDRNMYETVAEIFRQAGYDQNRLHKQQEQPKTPHSVLSMDISKIRSYGIEFPDTAEEAVRIIKDMNGKGKSDDAGCDSTVCSV